MQPDPLRPRGFTGLPAHPAEEAAFIDQAALTVSACPDREEGTGGRVDPYG